MERIHLNITDEDKAALHRARRLALRDKVLRTEFDRWMNGDYGPVLFTARINRCPTTGTPNATLEFTDRFAEFLAALGARNLDGHVP
jgi:hypothetical protein